MEPEKQGNFKKQGEHTRVTVLSFWEGEIAGTPIIHTASAAPGQGQSPRTRIPRGNSGMTLQMP